MKKIFRMFKNDYRHFICLGITIVCLLFTFFRFDTAFVRLWEAIRDFGLSIAYYVTELFFEPGTVTPTVTQFSSVTWKEVLHLPENWTGFESELKVYLARVFSAESFAGYLSWLSDGLYHISKALLLLLPLIICIVFAVNFVLTKHNNRYGEESRPLQISKKIYDKTLSHVVRWCSAFGKFVKDNYWHYYIWLIIWAFNFNVFTIIIEFLAFYFYFVVSFDVIHIYTQVVKLLHDLTPMLTFVPILLWIVFIVLLLHYLSIKQGYKALRHREMKNRGYLNERGVFTTVYGEMNKGKTANISDASLSTEVEFRDQAFDIILECDFCFPHFPWILLENELKIAIEYHEVFDRFSCIRWAKKKQQRFEKDSCRAKIFNYDYERYDLYYHNNLKNEYVWETISDYACAYMIYITRTALILANYSIRLDDYMIEQGNFPMWNTDFFKRDARQLEKFSRFCHILDFDMLRLGKRMVEENPQAFAFGFGVYVISEIDKERKNMLELKEVKANAKEANQKNDLFNTLLKMSRHNCVVRNRVFIKIFADLQRPESLGGDARELGEVVYIDRKSDMAPILPFYAPFYFFDVIYHAVFRSFTDTYYEYRFARGDTILMMHGAKKIVAKLKHFHDRMENLFGSQTLSLLVESGRMDGKPLKRKYYMQAKKCFSERYSTDCQSGIFEKRATYNRIGINDIKTYLCKVASWEELNEQHSYFQADVSTIARGGGRHGIS